MDRDEVLRVFLGGEPGLAIRLLADKLKEPRPFAQACMILGYPRAEELAKTDDAVDSIFREAALADPERTRIVGNILEVFSVFTNKGVWL